MGQPLLFAAVSLAHLLGNGGARWAAALPAAVVVVYSWDVRKTSPSDMSRSAVLTRLLGAPTEMIRVFGKDLDFPKGAAPAWRRWIPPAEFWEPPLVRAARAQGTTTRVEIHGADVDKLHVATLSALEIGPFEQPRERVHDEPVSRPPRLPGAKLSYGELFDLRAAFRRIDAGAGEDRQPEWASALEEALEAVHALSENAALMLRGRVDLKLGANSPEARITRVVDALAEADAAAARLPPLRPLHFLFVDGFGTLPPFKVRRNRGGRPLGPSDFLAMCEAVGLTAKEDIADVGSLEVPEKNLLSCLVNPVNYWRKALNSYRRRKLAKLGDL